MQKRIYLASPYSHPDPVEREARFCCAAAATAHLMKTGAWVYSPIVNSAPLAERYGLPQSWDFWRELSRRELCRSDLLYVLTLSGWKESVGVQQEIQWARGVAMDIWLYEQTASGYVAVPEGER